MRFTTRGTIALATGTAFAGVALGTIGGHAIAASGGLTQSQVAWAIDTATDSPPANHADLTALETAYAQVVGERDASRTFSQPQGTAY